MLYFIITWNCLIILLFLIGIGLLSICKADCFKRSSDRFIAAIWLGIIAFSLVLLTSSLVLPLSPLVGWGIAVSLAAVSLISKQTQNEIVALRSSISLRLILGFLTLELLVAVLTTQQIVWFDTGLYHLGSIRWLSEFGAVPGVALINAKFGFTSSWFAFAAPLIPKFVGDRVGAIANGFVFLIAIIHTLITITHIFQNKAQLSDWFWFVYSGLLIPVYLATAFTGSPILISFSPDVPVNLLIGIIAWSILIISQTNTLSESRSNRSILEPHIIPLILSSGAVAIKLSALPLLPGTLLFYGVRKSFRFQRLFWGILLIILLLLPGAIFGIKTSGCPLYPSRLMCLDLPWTLLVELTKKEVSEIKFFEKVAGKESGLNKFILAYWRLFETNREFQIMVLLIVLSIIFSIFLIKKSNFRQQWQQIWVIFIGFSGIVFIMAQSPLLRFGIGYFILIPALFIAGLGPIILERIQPIFERSRFSNLARRLKIIPLVSLFLVSAIAAIAVQDDAKSRLLLPAELARVPVIKKKVNDVEYAYPANWTVRCWTYELPCAPVPVGNIKLRDPSRGIGGGFVNAK
jgi:hypothetical protein